MSVVSIDRRPAVPVQRRLRRVLWHAVCLAIFVVMLYPVVWLISMSFKSTHEIVSSLSFIPEEFIFGNYTTALKGVVGVSIWQLLGNSLALSTLAVVGNVFSCSLAAYAFARLRFRLRGPLFAFMLASIMLPTHVVLISQYTIFNELEMIGTFVPLVLPKFLATDAFFIFLIVQFMRGLPPELGDAARIDGCGPIRAFLYVILPLTRPALITTAIFTFIWTYNDFLSQVVYLNNPERYTMLMALSLYVDQTSEQAFGVMFAMSVLSLLPIGLFFFAFQRYLIGGMSTSGLGGT